MRVKKEKERNKTKGETPNHKQKSTTTARGKQRYDKQVCYGPIHPTYHIPRNTCVDEKTKYVRREGAQGTTPHAKKNDDPPRTS